MADFVTVVSGVPRSGTSLMMQMLRAGGMRLLSDAARAPDADNPRGYFELEQVKRLPRETAWLDAASGAAVKVVHALVPLLPVGPGYRVILMRRRLVEVLASQDAMLARLGHAPDPLQGARVAAVLSAQYHEVERWAGGRSDVALLVVDYNALIEDPAAGAAAVADFLGGGLDRAAMTAAVEPGLYRQRRVTPTPR